ncbi:ATP-dependent helicase HrpB [Govanella unica]|uniref:ATP-dependent helicase HrpB n=1 Tax=Govanella unica TaxID=2975056 RepID=A0A9X3Z7M1_9PROT|nr:ATP-dependent helicase HrpB [Govania unica]MDA5194385.1 ATP-dependent helicase HrpB [Govania unica]
MISVPDVFNLPIDDVLPAIRAGLARSGGLVLEAPPGAGKTTVVPLALLGESWRADRKILMLEPRRIAARAAARRMAQTLGEEVGGTVGYAMRLERKISRDTRIEVVTEGVLIRRLQRDPELSDVALVIFDEFHERSLDADLGLALTLEARDALRPDLKILIMSATLDGAPVAALLGGAEVLRSEGRSYPVETRFLDRTGSGDLVADSLRAVRRALEDEDGSILVFLPGVGEIRRLTDRLADGLPSHVLLAPLYGDLSAAEQDQAIRPAPAGMRKIVIATSIAETSLTIDGVRVVIDCGRARLPVFDPVSGMTRLETVKVSAASATQRRGRAGRVAPGVCYRLWTEAEDRALLAFTPPEIMAADLAPLALELAVWGTSDANELQWLTPPPAAALAQARDLLQRLGALDDAGLVTAHGREMAALPVHPRLAHMLIRGKADGGLAALIAATLGDRDPFRADRARADRDLRSRIEAMGRERDGVFRRLIETARRLTPDKLVMPDPAAIIDRSGPLLALAYPDRVARRRGDARGSYQLANGRGAQLDPTDPLANSEYLAIAALDGDRATARIYLAAPLDLDDIEELFADRMETQLTVAWDPRNRAVQAVEQERLDALILAERPVRPAPERMRAAVADGIRMLGLAALPWTRELEAFRGRVEFAARHDPDGGWPDFSDAGLLARLDDWLGPYLDGVSRESQFGRIDLGSALRGQLDWAAQQKLDQWVPSHWTVPSGSRLPIDYGGERPLLSVRLQEMFGATQTPTVMNGRVAVTLQLLSPAQRPVQVTQDLVSFWDRGYADVKRDLKGRYPKHFWPDDPRAAPPTARIKPRPRA